MLVAQQLQQQLSGLCSGMRRASSRRNQSCRGSREKTTCVQETYLKEDRLVGLVVKASASRAGDPGFESRLRRDFFGVESYQ